jgi:hypothetical protein
MDMDVVYTAQASNLWGPWGALALIAVVCAGISVLLLSMDKAGA